MVYKVVFNLHIFVSIITMLAGVVTVARSVTGWICRKEYSRFDNLYSLSFTVGLYFQLLIGFVIYFLLRTSFDNPALKVPESGNDASLRFWAIEHIALMLFALFLTQIGRIYMKKSVSSLKRFKASVFYYGTSLFMILFSLGTALFYKYLHA